MLGIYDNRFLSFFHAVASDRSFPHSHLIAHRTSFPFTGNVRITKEHVQKKKN